MRSRCSPSSVSGPNSNQHVQRGKRCVAPPAWYTLIVFKSATGFSFGEDAHATAVEAATACKNKLAAAPQLAIVVASVSYDQEKVLRGIQSVIGESVPLIGASTAGEITEVGPLARRSVALMLLTSDSVRFHLGVGPDVKASPRDAGAAMARAVLGAAGEDAPKLLVMFPDVLAGNGAEIVRGVQTVVGAHFPVVGGAAGDDFKFERTYQYFNGQVHSGAVVGFGISGAVCFGVGVKHGWVPIGVPMKVTRSEGSVLHELDGKPAISVYEEYFGEDGAREVREEVLAKLAITYPLGMKLEHSDELLIRDPLSVDAHGSITCAAEIPEGAEIRLMVGSREEAIRVAKEAARSAVEDLCGKQIGAALIFNCIARSKLFGEWSKHEIAAIQEHVGADTPLLGFYTYGEQAPIDGEVRNMEKCNPAFHNETVVITLLAEDVT